MSADTQATGVNSLAQALPC